APDNGIVASLGRVEDLLQVAMRHVLERIEVLVMDGDFEPASPAACAVEEQAAGVGNLGAIDIDLVVVEAFVLGRRNAHPGTVRALRHGVSYAAQIEQHTLGLGRDDARADAPFRVDLGVLFALLVERRGFEIFHRRDLGRCKRLLRLLRLLGLPRRLRLRSELRRVRNCPGARQHSQRSQGQESPLYRIPSAEELDLGFKGIALSGKGRMWRMTGDSLNAATGWAETKS